MTDVANKDQDLIDQLKEDIANAKELFGKREVTETNGFDIRYGSPFATGRTKTVIIPFDKFDDKEGPGGDPSWKDWRIENDGKPEAYSINSVWISARRGPTDIRHFRE